MQFFEKLNLLMNIFNTTNSQLAKNLKIDPSLISRWRKGTRKPPVSSNYFFTISNYFIKHATSETKKKLLSEIINISPAAIHASNTNFSEQLCNWLSDNPYPDNNNYLNAFIENITNINTNNSTLNPMVNNLDIDAFISDIPIDTLESVSVFYGEAGKRMAMLRFLYTIIQSEEKHELLLISDDNMDWLSSNKNYLFNLTKLIYYILSKGHSIKIIHTLNRNISELLLAIDAWLPLHLTGGIKSYYCPKYKDSLFKHTFFAVPDLVALSSICVSNNINNNATHIFFDKENVTSISSNFNLILEKSKPLVEFFSDNRLDDYYTSFLDFSQKPGNCLILNKFFSSATLPNALLDRLLTRLSIDSTLKNKILRLHNIRIKSFELYLEHNQYTEIISLEFINNLINNLENTFIPLEGFGIIDISYTAEELILHTENIILLLDKNPNFTLYLSPLLPNNKESNFSIYTKLESGVFVTQNKSSIAPFIAAYLNENNLTEAFVNYANNYINKTPKLQNEREYIKDSLLSYIDELTKNNLYIIKK